MARYPRAKVVLTVRDPQAWYASAAATIGEPVEGWEPRTAGDRMRRLVVWQGVFDGRFRDRAYAVARFEAHAAEVRRRVPPDRLLEYEVRQGWEPLCRFLGVAVPDEPFPHLNTTESFRAARGALREPDQPSGQGP